MLELVFLGTSSGVPTKERNVSAVALKLPEPKSWVLVDCGEGTQHQILHTRLSLQTLKAIFITHIHGDHCYGLPGLIASAGMSGRTEPLYIIAPKGVQLMYEAIRGNTQLHTPYDVIFIETEAIGTYSLGDTEVTAHKLSHRVPSHGFCFTTTTTDNSLQIDKLDRDGIERGPVWGKLQQGLDVTLPDGTSLNASDYVETTQSTQRIVIAGDNDQPALLSSVEGDIDVLVHESTYTEALLEKAGPGPQHSSAKRVATFAAEYDIPNLVLTHFSARFQATSSRGDSIDDVKVEAESVYDGNLYLANDFDTFSLTSAGKLVTNKPAFISPASTD